MARRESPRLGQCSEMTPEFGFEVPGYRLSSESDAARLSVASAARFRCPGIADGPYRRGVLAPRDRLAVVRCGGWGHPQPPMASDRDRCPDTGLRIHDL